MNFRKPPILGRLHGPGPLVAAAREVPLRPEAKSYGLRGTFKPTIALHTLHRLGPVRHALAQRLISGVLEVHAPWADAVARGEEPKTKK